jgi:hypothetical protein
VPFAGLKGGKEVEEEQIIFISTIIILTPYLLDAQYHP